MKSADEVLIKIIPETFTRPFSSNGTSSLSYEAGKQYDSAHLRFPFPVSFTAVVVAVVAVVVAGVVVVFIS